MKPGSQGENHAVDDLGPLTGNDAGPAVECDGAACDAGDKRVGLEAGMPMSQQNTPQTMAPIMAATKARSAAWVFPEKSTMP